MVVESVGLRIPTVLISNDTTGPYTLLFFKYNLVLAAQSFCLFIIAVSALVYFYIKDNSVKIENVSSSKRNLWLKMNRYIETVNKGTAQIMLILIVMLFITV